METATFEKITLKKVLWSYILFSIIILVFTHERMMNMTAFSLGTALGCIKLIVMGKLSTNIVTPDKNFKLTLFNFVYVLAIFIFYGLIALSAAGGVSFFVFFTCGVLLINFVVFINSVLELLGLAKNNY